MYIIGNIHYGFYLIIKYITTVKLVWYEHIYCEFSDIAMFFFSPR